MPLPTEKPIVAPQQKPQADLLGAIKKQQGIEEGQSMNSLQVIQKAVGGKVDTDKFMQIGRAHV